MRIFLIDTVTSSERGFFPSNEYVKATRIESYSYITFDLTLSDFDKIKPTELTNLHK
jgi:hypothetical protein